MKARGCIVTGLLFCRADSAILIILNKQVTELSPVGTHRANKTSYPTTIVGNINVSDCSPLL